MTIRNRLHRSPFTISMLVALLLAGIVAASVAYQRSEAAASGSSALDINGGNPVTVGANVPYKFTIVNNSTTPQHTENVLLTSISGYPSCEAIELVSPLCATPANQNPGVFSPDGLGTGADGTACDGNTFTVSVGATGLWTFTPLLPAAFPTLGPSTPGGLLATCEIEGFADVLTLPTDADAGAPGLQTRQLSDARGTTSVSSQQFVGIGTAIVTVEVDATLATTATPTGTGVAPGTSVSDTATLTVPAGAPVPTGTVAFFLCQPAAVTAAGCPSPAGTQIGTPAAGEPVSAAGVATSEATTTTTAIGTYCWRAEYSGDDLYDAITHTNATTECFTTVPGDVTIVTTSNPTGSGVEPGTSVTDTATVSSSAGPAPTGTVTFFLCQPAAVTAAGCPSPAGTQVGAPEPLVAGSATSDATTNTSAVGTYCWRAEYSGDAVYDPASHTNSTTECFTTVPGDVTIVTTSNPTGGGVTPGTSVTDTATVSGTGPTPTGNVTFFLCQPAAVTAAGCPSPAGTQVGAVKALVAGSATSDATTNTTAVGKYCWRAEYAGDAVYDPATHTNATTECFTVAVRDRPDLTVTKELKPRQPSPSAGGRLYYLVRVTNIGTVATPPPPFNVTLIDTPPAGTNVVAWSILSGSGKCSLNGAGQLVCDLGASMAPGASTVVEVVIRTPVAGTLINTAEVDPFKRIAEANEDNNKTTLETTIPAAIPAP